MRCRAWFEPDAHSADRTHTCVDRQWHDGPHNCHCGSRWVEDPPTVIGFTPNNISTFSSPSATTATSDNRTPVRGAIR